MRQPFSQLLTENPNLKIRMAGAMRLNSDTVKMLMQSTKFDKRLALETKSIRDLIVYCEVYIMRDGNGVPLT